MTSQESGSGEDDMLEPGGVLRDSSGMISSVVGDKDQDSKPIQGPLGIYPFPILNAILSNVGGKSQDSNVVVTEIHRDDNGRVQAIEEIKV